MTPLRLTTCLLLGFLGATSPAGAAGWTLVGWNNLGMHCMDGDYAVFALLPPYNTIQAQLIDPDPFRPPVPSSPGSSRSRERRDGACRSPSAG
jgi:hypothetical protein